MSAIPLLTSLPPSLKRPRADGVDVGRIYQEQCVQSWRAAGFHPVSINSRQELEACPELFDLAGALGVTIVPVDRDARAVTGRPHILLADMLASAGQLTDGVFAFANADILLSGPTELYAFVERLERGRFAALPRADFLAIGDASGRMFAHGYDFFAMHHADLKRVPDIGLIIGAPWWDHYLPILLLLTGAKLTPHTGPPICHLVHEDRWNWAVWANLGWRFAGAMHQLMTRQPMSDAPLARYAEGFHAALVEALRHPPPTEKDIREALSKISDLNIALLREAVTAPLTSTHLD